MMEIFGCIAYGASKFAISLITPIWRFIIVPIIEQDWYMELALAFGGWLHSNDIGM